MQHLLYHVYPLANHPAWVWNLDQITKRFSLFDRIIVGIAQDHNSVPAATVSRYLKAYPNIEFVLANNRPGKGELTTLPIMLDMVKSTSEEDRIFYAHAKGVSRTGSTLKAVLAWAEAMYDLNFRPDTLDLLQTYDCVGAFKRGGPTDPSPIGNRYNWHYSGNFWWAKHSAIFTKDWLEELKGRRHAAENFLGELIPCDRAGSVGPVGVLPLYNWRAWRPPHGEIAKALSK